MTFRQAADLPACEMIHLLDWRSMRKEYHLRPGAAGFDAWDVDRLVALSRDLPVQQVPLDSFWQVDRSYPIILAADGRVMDGMHRVVRALIEGDRTISAVQFDVTPVPDHRDCQPQDLPYPDDDSTGLNANLREAHTVLTGYITELQREGN